MENADYMATHKDYSESVDALERAIAVLKKQAYDRSQAELMQVRFFCLLWVCTVRTIISGQVQDVAQSPR